MPGKANRSLAASADDAERLIFFWSRRNPGIFWLWGFLVLSLLLHAAGFYLFQVVYPSSGRLEPFPARVLILDEKNASNAVLLQELNDRLVFLQPASVGSGGRKSIDDFSVSFRPSFADRAPPFRSPLGADQSSKINSAIGLPEKLGVIPPFRAESMVQTVSPNGASAIKPPEEKPAIRRRWILGGDLAQRAISITQAEALDRSLPHVGEGPEIVLNVIADAAGEVIKLSVKSGSDHPAVADFVEAVKKQLKFNPIPDSESMSGELTIGN